MKLKKILASILAIAMVLSTMGTVAFAADEEITLPAVDVAVGGDDGYTTWSEALANANDVDGDGIITYGVYGKIVVDTSAIKGKAESIYIIGMTDDAELSVETKGNGNFYIKDNTIVTVDFVNITLSRLNGSWISDADNTNKFFTVWTYTSKAKQVNYTNCVFPNGSGNAYPGKTVYSGCDFTNTGDSDFGVWIYAIGETVIEGCTFNCNAGVKTYGYAGQKNMNTVVENSSFTCTKQPAFVTSGLGSMTINDVEVDSTYGLVANGGLGGLCNVTIDGNTPNYVAGVTTTNKYNGVETIYVTDADYIEVITEKIINNSGTHDTPVTGTVMLANANGTAMYATLDEAINALTAGDNEITLLANVEQDITILQQTGVNVTLDGNNNEFDGTININGNGRYNGAETLTIKNVNFVTDGDTSDFIYADNEILLPGQKYIYAHNVTVQDCTFTSADPEAEVCGLQFRQGNNINVINCEFSNMHSAMWATGTKDIEVDNITATNMQNGISAGGASTGFVVKNSTINVTSEDGYGIRTDGVNNSDLTVENNTIEAYYPIIVRNTNSDTYSLNVAEGNVFTATNPDGYDIAVTAGKDDAPLAKPAKDIQITIDETVDTNVFTSHEAKISGKYFATVAAAVAAAVAGDTITLLADGAVDNFNSTHDLTFDLNNNKFTFADANSAANENRHVVSHNITFKNGSIDIKADEFVNITTNGAVTLDNVTSEMLDRTNTTFYVYGTLNIVNGSDIKISTVGKTAITADYDSHVLNIDASTVTVDGAYLAYNNGELNLSNGGKFIAKNLTGSAFNSVEAELTSGSEIVIDNTAYHGFTNGSLALTDSTMTVTNAGYYGVNLTNDCTLDNSTLIVENCDLAKGRSGKSINVGAGKKLNATNNSTVEVKGDGTTIYLANDASSAIKDATSNIVGEIVTGNVTSEDSVASAVKLTFEPTTKQEVYNIYVEAVDGTINRMSAVQVKFALETLNGEKMDCTLAPASELGVTLTNDIDDEEAYVFNYNGVNTPDKTGTKLLLGTVTFGGYGEFNFTVDTTYEAKVKTAQLTDNIVEEYVPTPDAANEKQGKFDIASSALTGAAVVEAKRDVKIVIDFNNELSDEINEADYNDMTVTLTGSNGEVHTAQVGDLVDVLDAEGNVTGKAPNYTAEKAEMTFNVTAGYRYTVVVKGEGYRTARYSTNVDAADNTLVLTFWNNALENADRTERFDYIEEGVERSLKSVTFLAGDIAQDNIIDKYDLAAVVSYFGYDNLKTDKKDYVKYDLNRDGKIDADDISYVLVSWGK